MKGGRHIRFAKPTPLANLHLTLLDKVGVRLDSFADSKGQVDELLSTLRPRHDRCDACAARHDRMLLLLATGRASAADTPLADAAERAEWPQVRTLLARHVDVERRPRPTA